MPRVGEWNGQVNGDRSPFPLENNNIQGCDSTAASTTVLLMSHVLPCDVLQRCIESHGLVMDGMYRMSPCIIGSPSISQVRCGLSHTFHHLRVLSQLDGSNHHIPLGIIVTWRPITETNSGAAPATSAITVIGQDNTSHPTAHRSCKSHLGAKMWWSHVIENKKYKWSSLPMCGPHVDGKCVPSSGAHHSLECLIPHINVI